MKTQAKPTHFQTNSPFDELAQRLQAWRATRRPGHPMPEELWQGAARLARLHGLNPTATALKLHYYGLQRRLTQAPPKSTAPPTPAQPTFLELPTPVFGKPLAGLSTLELSRSDGARLSIGLSSLPASDLPCLVARSLAEHANTCVGVKQVRRGDGLQRLQGRQLALLGAGECRVAEMNRVEETDRPALRVQRLKHNGLALMTNAHSGGREVKALRQTHGLKLGCAKDRGVARRAGKSALP